MRKLLFLFLPLLLMGLFSCSNEEQQEINNIRLERSDNHFFGVKLLGDNVTRGVAQNDKLWHGQTVIRVKFLNDPYNMKQKVKTYAAEWEKYASVKFEFVESGEAHVRIGFDWNNDRFITWSYVGTDCKALTNQNEATMSFAYMNELSEKDIKADVLRAFGMVLGLELEHRHLGFDPGWTSRISQYWAGEVGDIPWTELKKYVFDPIAGSNLVQTKEYDENSIMIWPFMSRYAQNTAREVNYELSKTDIEFIGQLYPKSQSTTDNFVKMSHSQSYMSFNVYFHEDTSISINWGDGNVQNYIMKKHTWILCSHSYPNATQRTVSMFGDTRSLKGLNLHGTGVSSLDVSKSYGLNWIRCAYTNLTTLDLSRNTEFTDLYAGESSITHLDFSNNPNLQSVVIHNSPIATNQTALTNLVKSLPRKAGASGEIFLNNSNSSPWVQSAASSKNWVVLNRIYDRP